jgi:putative sugar O-methyltransferase
MIKESVKRALRKQRYHVVRISDEERAIIEDFERSQSIAPADFGPKLSTLRDLKNRYASVRLPIASHSIWTARGGDETKPDIGRGGVDLQSFRGHSAYVFSYAGPDPITSRLRYFIYADAVRRKDSMKLLDRLNEDGAFGCVTFEYRGLGRVSRDLLDSVVELNFLQKHLQVLERDDLNVLDVGAGYGRMAHRMLQANPRIKSYTCVDAVPESTFLCDLYLQYRGLRDRARVIPLDELEQQLSTGHYDLALNIHSFAECTFEAIEWWLGRLKALSVRHLMIVQNDPERFLSTEPDQTRRDYKPLLEKLGYETIARERVFDDPAAEEVMGVRDNMFLFRL